ncbi:response regulator transcription factor [Cytobacillus sp. IB215665]|uniref:response regulator transcription factor n=1 Tax=Cytobacillus sp. IB215665 TaxID=3097357 RepID=UPI002A14888A|nr:response regulator transcription factor [Cytobacillus sp. IB215665]MDX8365893.1 response regulator transcription factor [Cytobacillus sp. IB215665]
MMTEKKKVMIVDDEEDMRNLIQMYVERDNFETYHASDGNDAFNILDKTNIDIIILDVMMPDIDGFTFCEKLRQTSNIPIIFLTARGDEWDRVYGLKMGADDYIVKPFSPSELIARIDAVLRRTNQGRHNDEGLFVKYGSLEINEKGRKVRVNGSSIGLTLKEFDLLLFFCKHLGQALSREQLLEGVWGFDYKGGVRTVDTHIKTLRIKLGGFGDSITTVWGIGYKLEV